MTKEKIINPFMDAEWYLNPCIFLIDYSYDNKHFGQLYGKKLALKDFKNYRPKFLAECFTTNFIPARLKNSTNGSSKINSAV